MKLKKLSEVYQKSKVKKFLNRNQDGILSGAKFISKCLGDAQIFSEKIIPRAIDYASLALKLHSNYAESFVKVGLDQFGDKWVLNNCGEFNRLIFKYLKEERQFDVFENYSDGITFFVAEPEAIAVYHNKDSINQVYIRDNDRFFRNFFREKIWQEFNGFINLDYQFGATSNQTIIAADTLLNFFLTEESAHIVEYIEKYKAKGYGRSILLHGPPGTGKSNVTRAIVNQLGRKTIKMAPGYLNAYTAPSIRARIEMLDAEVVIFEDIDHVSIDDKSALLNLFDYFSHAGKIIIASVNQVGALNPALTRPGRFDKLFEFISMSEPAILSMVQNDREMYENVKEMPVAYIREIMKICDVEGRDVAMGSIEGLKNRMNVIGQQMKDIKLNKISAVSDDDDSEED